jgi:hypothetical protein
VLLIPGDTFSVDREIPASAGNCITFYEGSGSGFSTLMRVRILPIGLINSFFFLATNGIQKYKNKFVLECTGNKSDPDPEKMMMQIRIRDT